MNDVHVPAPYSLNTRISLLMVLRTTMVDHLWDSTILGCHKEGVYADESVVVIARSPRST